VKLSRLPGVAAVRLYRHTAGRVPRTRRCLFDVSCSRHVEATLEADGLRAAWHAMRTRMARCRPGYEFLFGEHGPAIQCADGAIVPVGELSGAVCAEVRSVETVLQPITA